jgi:class 3 adenylate cyclase/tetratricopeptide (TPR) repeat protein
VSQVPGNAPVKRILAVLYTDQVGSTAMARAMGDQLFDAVRREIDDTIRAAASRHAGTVVKSTGDGALVVFDSASDAVDAAIDLQTQIDLMPPRGDLRTQMRIGISVGDVAMEGGDCYGIPVVESARLEAAARPGGILCTDLARMVAGSRTSVTFLEHPPIEAKGFSDAMTVWEIPWTSTAAAGGILPETLGRPERLPFAGRHSERAVLEAALEQTKAGGRRGVLVAGEPGVGKSRLVREVARRAAASGAIVLHGRCDDGMGRPYQPFAEALAGFLRQVPGASEQLGEHAGELRNLLPEVGQIVSGLPEPLPGDAETVRQRLFEAVAEWLACAARRGAVMLVIDDLHWADRTTGQLVRHLLTAHDGSGVMLAITFRDTEPDGDLDLTQLIGQLRRLENVDRVSLTGLDVEAVQELMSGAGRQADRAVAEELCERTGGNAFFTGEVLLGLQGDLAGPGDLADVPDAVRDVVVARVGRLSAGAKTVLEVASVFGRIVSLDQLCEVLGRPRREITDLAIEAVDAGLLTEPDNPPLHLQFTHALVRTSLYGELGPTKRAVLHADAATAMLTLAGDRADDVAEQLGGHLARTGSPDDMIAAISWFRRAGQRASRQAAEAAAATQFRRALDVLDQPGAPDDTTRLRCEVLVDLGNALRRGRLDGFRSVLLSAGDLARTNGFHDLLVTAAASNTRGFFSSAGATDHGRIALLRDALAVIPDHDVATRARLLSNLSVELTFETHVDERLALSDQAVQLASSLDDADHLFHVLGMRYGTLWSASGLPARVELAREVVALADRLGRDELRYLAAWCSFQAAMESGDLELADRMLDQQRAIAANKPTQLSYLKIREGLRAAVAGDLEAAERFATEAFDSAVIAGEPDAYTFYVGQLLGIRYHQGRLDELLPLVSGAVDASPGLPSLNAGLGLIHLEAGRLPEVRQVVAELGPRWRQIGDELNWLITIALLAELAAGVADRSLCAELHGALSPYRGQFVDNATNWFGSVARHLGLLEHVMGRTDDADRSFAEALEAHQRLPAPLLAARTHLAWAESLLGRIDPDPAAATIQLTHAKELAAEFGLAKVDERATRALSTITQELT